MKILYVAIFMFATLGFAQGNEFWVDAEKGKDGNPGTKELPLKTPEIAVWLCGNEGGLVHLNGIFYTGLTIKKTHYKKRLIIDGHNSTMLYGFEGTFQQFDPANPPYRNWNVLKLMDCGRVLVRNLEVWGGCDFTVNINDSYPEIGVRDVVLEGLVIRYGAPRCLFMGGH
ncbi:MAG: hypothetical protein ACYTG7_20420, partial [Planctomycetota bacterium]